MGVTLNIIDLWEPFKAAKMALVNTLEADNVNSIASIHHQKLNVSWFFTINSNLFARMYMFIYRSKNCDSEELPYE